MTASAQALVSLQEIRAAHERIRSWIVRTPSIRLRPRREIPPVHYKLELFQKTGSFKVRGVFHKLSRLSDEERERGVITISSGNHAQALAYGAGVFGVPSTIVMPSWSDPGKVRRTREYGGEVLLTDENLLETVEQVRRELRLTMVHPFDDLEVIAGAGSLGLEIVEDVPKPDLVLVSIGGGGLISGVAAAVKQSCPSARVVGVEPAGADVMTRSLAAGEPVTLAELDTVADGLAAPFAGKHTLEHVRAFVDEVVTVTDAEILEALRWLLEHCKLVTEPAASAAFAPLLTGAVVPEPGQEVVCVVCGANVSPARLREFLEG